MQSAARRFPGVHLSRSILCTFARANRSTLIPSSTMKSSGLKSLDIGIAALSEVWRPDCGEIMVGGYTYYWSGRSDGYHAQGVAVTVQ